MKIRLTEKQCEAIGLKNLKPYKITADYSFHYRRYVELDMASFPLPASRALVKLLEKHHRVKGIPQLIAVLQSWIALISGDSETKARTTEQFYSMLRHALEGVPGHRIYHQDDDRGVWWAYYVNEVEYHPPVKNKEYTTPPYVSVELVYAEFEDVHSTTLRFSSAECVHSSPIQALTRKGYFVETEELRAGYQEATTKFEKMIGSIGLQCLATGIGTDDVDGNKRRHEDRDSWWRTYSHRFQLDADGPSRVVVDLFQENADEDEVTSWRNWSGRVEIHRTFWGSRKYLKYTPPADADEDEDDDSWTPDSEADDDADDGRIHREDDAKEEVPEEGQEQDIEIPLHPNLAIFDMRRHLRLRVHVSQLREYEYDVMLGEKLVLPEESRDMVDLLIDSKGEFKDIVAGKGGGAVILCAGPPGTGKTLTAEVYAEVKQRPLYSVQASQLGIHSGDLEDELLKVFARAKRWDAILLLDEADVYIAARGTDMHQNSVVGVFLRVLEHYHGVMFMTTNRADIVDDAIASRCIARIDYDIPSPEDQAHIWLILSAIQDLRLGNDVIQEIVRRHPRLSGRDVKNLLKLAKMVAKSQKTKITADTIDFVQKFKPTVYKKEIT